MELIDGVKLRQLRLIPDSRGYLMEMLRRDWEEFMQFGQAYITACYPGVIKAWHYHKLRPEPLPRPGPGFAKRAGGGGLQYRSK
ncbi:hypothetical protein SEF58_09295 [Neomoorella humiferrea]